MLDRVRAAVRFFLGLSLAFQVAAPIRIVAFPVLIIFSTAGVSRRLPLARLVRFLGPPAIACMMFFGIGPISGSLFGARRLPLPECLDGGSEIRWFPPIYLTAIVRMVLMKFLGLSPASFRDSRDAISVPALVPIPADPRSMPPTAVFVYSLNALYARIPDQRPTLGRRLLERCSEAVQLEARRALLAPDDAPRSLDQVRRAGRGGQQITRRRSARSAIAQLVPDFARAADGLHPQLCSKTLSKVQRNAASMQYTFPPP